MNHTKTAAFKPLEFEWFGAEDGSHQHAITQMHSRLADHHMKKLAR